MASDDTHRVNVYRVELLVIDHDGIGEDGVKRVLAGQRYPNHCISPMVKRIETRAVDWSDEHPLNQSDTHDAAYRALFAAEGGDHG